MLFIYCVTDIVQEIVTMASSDYDCSDKILEIEGSESPEEARQFIVVIKILIIFKSLQLCVV